MLTCLLFQVYIDMIYILCLFSLFQMPALLSQVQQALGIPSTPTLPGSDPVPSTSKAPNILPAVSSSASPIIAEASGSEDEDVQTIAVPFRSGNSDAYLPMISVDDSWSSDTEFRFVNYSFAFFCLKRVFLMQHFISSCGFFSSI